jgi:carboxylate-amine ligase
MSTSSPLFQGGDTGYASYRTIAVSRWPTVGPPPDVSSAAEYDQMSADLVATGVIADPKMIYFDARVSSRYPTIEIRIADGCPLLDDVVLLAALGRALVATAAAEDAAGEPLPEVGQLMLRAATWRAARSGLIGDLVDPRLGRPAPAAEVVGALVAYVRPALTARGEWDEVSRLAGDLLARGSSAQRQRALLGAGADLNDVVTAVVRETAAE